jgi:hypothetical protein
MLQFYRAISGGRGIAESLGAKSIAHDGLRLVVTLPRETALLLTPIEEERELGG